MAITYISPKNNLIILWGVPLDNTYKNQLDFTSETLQTEFFKSKRFKTCNDFTPVRMQNKIKVPFSADEMYKANYIMFQNEDYNSKWFYAFITSIDYISANGCEIGFELDVWQTWQLEINILPSFIEREHSNTDNIGDNIIIENVELGDYVNKGNVLRTNHFANYKIVCASTVDENFEPVVGGYYGMIYSGLKFVSFSNPILANAWIEELVTKNLGGAIVSMFMMPDDFVTDINDTPKVYDVTKEKSYATIDGYTPRNNKLFTYPYNFLYVTNLNGSSASLRYEFFDTEMCTFGLTMDMSCNPTAVLVPNFYKHVETNWDEKLSLTGLPQCSWSVDTFRAWLAQNGASTGIGILSSAFGAVANASMGNYMGSAGGALNIAQSIAKIYETSTMPPQAHGSNSANTLVATRTFDFYFYKRCITKEYARVIDDYFNMFGYATHKTKVPNIRGRQYWNYVQTINCEIIGSVPFNDISRIKKMFNDGVTFWHGDWVGEYNRTNIIV